MTNREAVKTLLTGMHLAPEGDHRFVVDPAIEDDFLCAIGIAVSAIMKQEENMVLKNNANWHSAKIDPPKSNGMYNVRIPEGYNLFLIAKYEDGIWYIPKSEDNKYDIYLDVHFWSEID